MGCRGCIVSLGSAIAAVAMLSACSTAEPPAAVPVAAAESAGAERQARVPNEYLLMLESGADESVITEHYARFGIRDINALGDEAYLLILSDDPGPEQMEALILEDDRVKAIQPNLIYWSNRSGRNTK